MYVHNGLERLDGMKRIDSQYLGYFLGNKCVFAFYAVIVYAFCAHWVFAETGWLRARGMYDFAGGGPVHLLGGTNGCIAIAMVGPRTGRFDGTRSEAEFAPSSPTNILFGLFMLWWGCELCWMVALYIRLRSRVYFL